MFGSSHQLATGPVAIVSLMTSTALAPLATAGSESFIAYAILLAFMVGLFQFLLGVLRLGMVVNFLSHPVVNGFTNAAALIIATSQLPKLFGVEVLSFCLSGELQTITEPYVPNRYERCDIDCPDLDTRPFPTDTKTHKRES